MESNGITSAEETDGGRPERVLLTGATGYIGGRLIDPLEAREIRLRCMARRPEHLAPRVAEETEIVAGDVLEPSSLREPLRDVDVAYYLIHSMGATGDFSQKDREAAENFAAAAEDAGVGRIIYLGGLGHGDDLSEHLRSRQQVGEILRASSVPTVELRASIIIGSGSLSFEMIRALVERLPVMICPRWVRTPTQPIAVEDVIEYLLEALDAPEGGSHLYEIGGTDRVSYWEIMQEYAQQRGLRRLMIPVPVLTPALSSLWLGLVTPLYARIGKKLVDGLRNPTVVRDSTALEEFDVAPRGIRAAIERALIHEDEEFARTRWSDAFSSAGEKGSSRAETAGWGGRRVGARRVDSRATEVPHPPSRAFAPIRRIGGRVGWYYGDHLWRIRGFLDLLMGGVGLRRGRRDPETPLPGDALDFWRVEAYEPDHLLRLRAEMKVPGRAWLQFEVRGVDDDGSEDSSAPHAGRASAPDSRATPRSIVRQTAVFDPVGLAGLLYWYGIYPIHVLVFRGMFRGIVEAMEHSGD